MTYLNLNVIFNFSDNLLQDASIIFQGSVNNFEMEQNMLNFGLGCSFPLKLKILKCQS